MNTEIKMISTDNINKMKKFLEQNEKRLDFIKTIYS